MKIYFVRHPQTLWNAKRLFQGSKEGGVTKNGKKEATEFAQKIKDLNVDGIYYADNKRCQYLADELIKVFPKAIFKKDVRINERSFGDLEGTSELEFANNSNFIFQDMESKYRWRPKNGESLEDVSIRVKEFLDDMKVKKVDNNSKFVITSGGIMKVVSYLSSVKTLDEAMQTKYKNLEVLEIVAW